MHRPTNTVDQRLAALRARIHRAELAASRPAGSVQLVAVSKTQPAADIVEAYRAGQRHFGESYVQEAVTKQAALGAFNITWHFIGPIQTNKTKAIAQNFDWVHSVGRLKVAERLTPKTSQSATIEGVLAGQYQPRKQQIWYYAGRFKRTGGSDTSLAMLAVVWGYGGAGASTKRLNCNANRLGCFIRR